MRLICNQSEPTGDCLRFDHSCSVNPSPGSDVMESKETKQKSKELVKTQTTYGQENVGRLSGLRTGEGEGACKDREQEVLGGVWGQGFEVSGPRKGFPALVMLGHRGGRGSGGGGGVVGKGGW